MTILLSSCDCGSSDDNSGNANPSDDDSTVDDDSMVDDDADDDASTTTTTVATTTTTTSPSGSSTTTTTVVTTTSSTTTTRPGEGTACNPYIEDPQVIDREKPYGPWPEFEERGITFRQILSTGAGAGPNDMLITGDGLIRVLAEDGRSLDVIAVGPNGEVSREVVDPRGGEWKVLGKDADDQLYVLYTVLIDSNPQTWEVRAATNKSGEWEPTLLFMSQDDENMSLDMTVDAGGLMHIAFSGRDDSPAAYYATWDGVNYTETQIIADDGNWRYVYTIALDSSGSPHMLVSDPFGSWHWRIEDDVWAGDLVAGNAFAWDLTIDANDVMHAGFAANGGHLVYGRFESGAWTFEDLDDCRDGVSDISVRLDASGHVHIAYTNGDQDDVLYATNASGEWVHTFIFEQNEEFDQGHAWNMASVVDATGKVHILHRRYNNYYYARDSDLNLTTNAGGEWVRRRLIKGTGWDFSPAILDSSGRQHMAFTRSRDGEQTLFYGLLDGDTWAEEVVEGPEVCNDGIYNPVLQLDSSETVYISYSCRVLPDERQKVIAKLETDSWSFDIVESTVDGLRRALFRIDNDDSFHLVFSRNTGTTEISEYWTNKGSGWESEVIPFDDEFGDLMINTDENPILTFDATYEENAVRVLRRISSDLWASELVDVSDSPFYGKIRGICHVDDSVRLIYLFQNDYRFASNETGEWLVEHLNLGVSGGSSDEVQTFISLDENDFSHVVLYAYNGNPDPIPDGLFYLENTLGRWTRHLIDSQTSSPLPLSLNIVNNDNLFVLYDFAGDEALMIARFSIGFE